MLNRVGLGAARFLRAPTVRAAAQRRFGSTAKPENDFIIERRNIEKHAHETSGG